MRPFAKVFAISACLICAMLLSGCICAVPICTLTPHSPRFQLPEAEWGATDRRLVVACYRLQYSKEPQPPVRFRVLSLSAEGSYEPPAELLIGLAGIGYVGEIRACAASQAPAAIAIFGPDGQVGIYDPVPTAHTLGENVRVPSAQRIGSVVIQIGCDGFEPLQADSVMGILLSNILHLHTPEWVRHCGRHEAIPRVEAVQIAAYVAAHAERFSRMTQLLARRLSDRHAYNFGGGAGSFPTEYADERKPQFESLLERCSAADREYLTRVWEDLKTTPSREFWPGGSIRVWASNDPQECQSCCRITAEGLTFRWMRGRRLGASFLFESDDFTRILADGMFELAICKPCLRERVQEHYEHLRESTSERDAQ